MTATFLAATFFAAGLATPELPLTAAFLAGAFGAAAGLPDDGLVVATLRAAVVLPAAFLGLTGSATASSIGSEALTRPVRVAFAFKATGFSPQISSSW